jgi:glutaredoxin 3
MANTRKVEIFSAGCPACQETVDLVKGIACPSCDVSVLNMNDEDVAKRAKVLGIHRVPAVVIDGVLADCCSVSAPDEQSLRAAGIGKQIK